MSEPIYDEDAVNLGYLNRILNYKTNDSTEISISKHYGSKPSPPYYAGDTWQDGNVIYNCIKMREIGFYNEEDWTTESGAKEEANNKNKIYLTKPNNYNVGDMWILQSDSDHKAGKKGEILITINGRNDYAENDWINMLGYGTIRSINEIANNINDAMKRLNLIKEEGRITIFYSNIVPEIIIKDDLWYVTDNVDNYLKGNVYQYDGIDWCKINDNLSIIAFEEANETRIVNDGKILFFYSKTEPINDVGVGDLWIDTSDNKLHRHNGTNWVAVYDTNVNQIRQDMKTIKETTVNISSDLGKIIQEVKNIETTVVDSKYKETEIGETEIHLKNAGALDILNLEIQGNKTYETNLYPRTNLYPMANIYPNQKG